MDEELAKELVFSVLSKGQLEKFNQEKEIDLSYDIENMGRFRINCYWERRNTAMAARLIPTSLPTMEELMLPQVVYSLSRLPSRFGLGDRADRLRKINHFGFNNQSDQ